MPVMTDTFIGTAAPLTQSGFDRVASQLGVDSPSLWSLVTVETRGFGYLPDRRPKILYERHIFHRRTNGRFSGGHPEISSVVSGGYAQTGAGEYDRLAEAMKLDRAGALESASWGLGQVMGFKAVSLGYPSVHDMIVTFLHGEDAQLEASRRFITGHQGLSMAFRSKNWSRVAFFYNGADFARNKYDVKLEQCCEQYTRDGVPSLEIRSAQVRLTYLGFDPRGVDGVLGKGTRAAVVAFQTANGISPTGELTDATLDALRAKSGV